MKKLITGAASAFLICSSALLSLQSAAWDDIDAYDAVCVKDGVELWVWTINQAGEEALAQRKCQRDGGQLELEI